MSFRSCGTGPGVQAPDGCSVELYLRTPYCDELEPYRSLFGAGTRVLELGCGTGRLTRRLIEWGAHVTAVDNCAEMLDAVPHSAARVLSDIETLRLEARFDVALLVSNFINEPDADVRRAFVDTARFHLVPGGHVLLERYDADWLQEVQPGVVGAAGDVAITVETVSRNAGVVDMTLRYDVDGRHWRHSFSAAPMSQAEIEALLSRCGFSSFAWSGKNNRWLRASRN